MDNPYTMSECESMLDAGTWPGGYVKDDAGKVTYVMKSATVYGYSGSGSGSGSGGSDFEFSTGSYDWIDPDTETGSEDDGKRPSTGNEGGTGIGTGGHGGGGSIGIVMPVMTQSEFDGISNACSKLPAVCSMLKTLHDAKKIVTYPTEAFSAAARYNSSKKRLEVSIASVDDRVSQTVCHELVHYVQDQMGLLADTSCNSEFQAHLMVCYMEAYKGMGGYDMPGFDKTDDNEITSPFYEYFDSIKAGKPETWILMEKKLDKADWEKYTEHFRENWTNSSAKPAYTNPYDSSMPWHWKEMFEAFGLIKK